MITGRLMTTERCWKSADGSHCLERVERIAMSSQPSQHWVLWWLVGCVVQVRARNRQNSRPWRNRNWKFYHFLSLYRFTRGPGEPLSCDIHFRYLPWKCQLASGLFSAECHCVPSNSCLLICFKTETIFIETTPLIIMCNFIVKIVKNEKCIFNENETTLSSKRNPCNLVKKSDNLSGYYTYCNSSRVKT